jgi:hypothetical protein
MIIMDFTDFIRRLAPNRAEPCGFTAKISTQFSPGSNSINQELYKNVKCLHCLNILRNEELKIATKEIKHKNFAL